MEKPKLLILDSGKVQLYPAMIAGFRVHTDKLEVLTVTNPLYITYTDDKEFEKDVETLQASMNPEHEEITFTAEIDPNKTETPDPDKTIDTNTDGNNDSTNQA
jgi:hypothetical protein